MICITITTSADRTPEEISAAVKSVLVVPVAEPVVSSELPIEPEAEAAEESFSRLIAKDQIIRDLKCLVAENKQETSRLLVENKNLRTLNNEMTRLFEEKIIRFETEAIVRKNPELGSFRDMLNKSRTIAELHESSKTLKKALDKKSAPRKPVRKGRNESSVKPVEVKTPLLFEEVTVADVSPKSSITKIKKTEDTISRLSAHRKRRMRT